jgi:hypothetical protein
VQQLRREPRRPAIGLAGTERAGRLVEPAGEPLIRRASEPRTMRGGDIVDVPEFMPRR